MQDIQLIPVAKDGEYIEVHPSTLDDHKRLGWVPCDHLDDGRVPEAEQRVTLMAELSAMGIEFNPDAPTDELRSLTITKPEVLAAAKKRGRPAKV